MMKNKKLFYVIAVLFLVGLSLFIWNNYQIGVRERPEIPTVSPYTLVECGRANCHGLDITCGQKVPTICTTEYRAGDRCRQYANCQVVSGQCKLVKTSKFDSCKSCVEKCKQDFKDGFGFFECESKCAE